MIIMIIATALSELPPITRVCEAAAAPQRFAPAVTLVILLLCCMALWSGIAAIVIALQGILL